MIQFIWKNWWRRKERLLLLLIGVFVISIGLSYLIGLSQINQATIVDELQQRWTASYDIIVRPDGSRSSIEQDQLLDPNYLSGLAGGISNEQYEDIKSIDEIEVAAPIAMVGYLLFVLNLEQLEIEDDGIYRMITEEVSNDGIRENIETETTYFTKGHVDLWSEKQNKAGGHYFLGLPYEYFPSDNNYYTTTRSGLLAGIDPEQEAKLVGLDQAILPYENSRFISNEDVSEHILVNKDHAENNNPAIYKNSIPVMVSNQTYTDLVINYSLEKIDLPYDDYQSASETLDMIDENGGEDYLDSLEGKSMKDFSYSDRDINKLFANSLSGVDIDTGEMVNDDRISYWDLPLVYKPSGLTHKKTPSPYPERWPYTYELEKVTYGEEVTYEAFREPIEYDRQTHDQHLIVEPYWVGYYDPAKLNISMDPLNELPMETYRPATADLVLDHNLNAINPPESLHPEVNPHSFLGNPPTMLTTIEAVETIVGDQPISAIRIKVAGVDDMSEASFKKLEEIAAQIEDKTGLITDITLGSSPQPTLTYVPEINDGEPLGWFQQPWIKIGSSITIFNETKVGFMGIILNISAVAIIYVFTSSFISLLTRRKEFALLLSVGWRPQQLSQLIMVESALLGGLAALLAWIILGFANLIEGTDITLLRFLLTGLIGLIIYLIGGLIPALSVQKVSPYEAMRTGEVSAVSKRIVKTNGKISMAFNHLIGKWKRSLLSILSIAMPTSLLALFLYITFRLQGIMYTTWLGQYITLEIGPVHYTAIIVTLMIAILTTGEVMWQNVSERTEEISLLKAIGWKNRSIRTLIWIEGLLIGIASAIIAILIACAILWFMYSELPGNEFSYILLTGLIPITVGLIGSIFPAEKAVRIHPIAGFGGHYSNIRGTEKRLRGLIYTILALLIAVLVYLLYELFIKS